MIKEQELTKKEIVAKEKDIFKKEVKEQKRVEKLRSKEEQLDQEERVLENAVKADAKRLEILEAEEKQAARLPQEGAVLKVEQELKVEEASLKKVLTEQKALVRDLKGQIKTLEK